LPHNLLKRLPLCELINQFVQVPRLLYQGILNFFHTHTAYYALNKRAIWVNSRGLGKKCLEVTLLFYLLLQPCLVIASQPADDLVDFVSGTILPLRFLDIQRIHFREFNRRDAIVVLHQSSDNQASDLQESRTSFRAIL